MGQKKICLVTSEHISYNPRLVKEADALTAAGYAVRVVALNREPEKWKLDQELMRQRSWRLESLPASRKAGNRLLWLRAALRQKLFAQLKLLQAAPGGLDRAYSRHAPELAALAGRESADLFLAHNLPALPAAATSARKWNAKLGFDAEDFHRGEFLETAETAEVRRCTALVEEKYIPRCDYLTAASDGIGREYAKLLRITPPLTILNVFPLSERAGQTPQEELNRERQGDGLSLYWYSQVIGPDRGLEDALRATALLKPRAQLHVRGGCANGYADHFLGEARRLGILDRVHLLVPVPPPQLVERAAQHDVGLALEVPRTENRKVALTNKIFTYLLAGIAVAASDVPSQVEIMNQVSNAGFAFASGEADCLANGLTKWLDDPEELARAKRCSRANGESRFCWEIESKKLIHAVGQVLN